MFGLPMWSAEAPCAASELWVDGGETGEVKSVMSSVSGIWPWTSLAYRGRGGGGTEQAVGASPVLLGHKDPVSV